MVYLIVAFSWWAILLNQKNDENYALKMQLSEYIKTVNKEQIASIHKKQQNMIISEGVVFGISIILGFLLIGRAFQSKLKLNQRLNDFLLSITHELKTPIATVKLVNKTLQREDLSETQKQSLLDTGWEETLRLESQVNNLLTAAQIEQSYKFNLQETNLDALLQEKTNRYHKTYPSRTIKYQGMPGVAAKLDKESFEKVIDNLVSNAVKYSSESDAVELSLHNNADKATIQIKDQGAGIEESELKNIWKKFYRIGNENTRETQGTGLGLWITKAIVDAHDGSISVTNNKPRGSIFIIKLPTRL